MALINLKKYFEKKRNPECNRLVSASKDSTAKIWDVITGRIIYSLSGHTMSITCVKWGGEGFIYTASQDRTIKVWDPKEVGLNLRGLFIEIFEKKGKMCKDLQKGHAHWINTLALNTDYVLRTGPYDNTGNLVGKTKEERKSFILSNVFIFVYLLLKIRNQSS